MTREDRGRIREGEGEGKRKGEEGSYNSVL